MQISIITATYNSQNTVKDTLESIQQQDYDNIEHIIIDGSSTDNTLNIVKNFQKNADNIKLISEKDNGIYDALNKGIELATGDVVGFLHSDDSLYSNSTISKIAHFIEQNNADAVYGDLVYISKTLPEKVIRYWQSGEFTKKRLRKGWMPPHPTLYVKKDIYGQLGTFNLEYKIAADYELMIRLLSSEKFTPIYLNEILYKMRIGGESNKSVKNIILKSKEDLRIINNYKLGGFPTLLRKNFSKIGQFFKRS